MASDFISTQSNFKVIPELLAQVSAEPGWVVDLTAGTVVRAALSIPEWVIEIQHVRLSPVILCSRLTKVIIFHKWRNHPSCGDVSLCTRARVDRVSTNTTFCVRDYKGLNVSARVSNGYGDSIKEIVIYSACVVIAVLCKGICSAVLIGYDSTTHLAVGEVVSRKEDGYAALYDFASTEAFSGVRSEEHTSWAHLAGVGHVQVSYSHPSRGAAIRSLVAAAAIAGHLAVDSHCSDGTRANPVLARPRVGCLLGDPPA